MALRKKKSLLEQASGPAGLVGPQLGSVVMTAKDKAVPMISDAKSKAAPVLADAKAKAAPVLADAKAKAGPAIASGAAIAAEKVAAGATVAAEKAAEAAERTAAAAETAAERIAEVAEPEKKKKGRKLRTFLLLTGLAAAAAFVAKKLQGSRESDNWQSSYTPAPAPVATETTQDEAGSSPDEAIADQTEAPHPISSPDDPAQVIDVDKRNL